MEQQKISVIVPVYKVEAFLDRCVQSIADQSYKNLEIIRVDDGSPDNCPALCDAWAEKDSRVKVIHKKNGGLSDARNAGMAIATGELMGFVDSDDWIAPDMYQHLHDLLDADGSDIRRHSAIEKGRIRDSTPLLRLRRQRELREGRIRLHEIIIQLRPITIYATRPAGSTLPGEGIIIRLIIDMRSRGCLSLREGL